VDVRLSPEQEALRQSAARVVDQLGPHAVGELADTERAAKLDAAAASSGWRELRTQMGDGTPLTSGVEVAIVAEELGRGLADTPFFGPVMACELRRLAGAAPDGTLETVALDSELSSLAGSAEGPPLHAVAVDAAAATHALFLIPSDAGGRLARIELAPDHSGLDLTRPSKQLGLESTAAPELPGDSISHDDLTRWTALGLALTCADLVGTMRGAVRLASDYAGGRQQYGVAIGSFQALQHLLADAFVVMEGSRSVALHAAWAVDALPPADALAAASVAKAYCARSARDVCETAIQVHGGIGNTWECLAHVHLRRALLSTEMLGGTGPSLDRVLEHYGIGS
jgi:hypothetical protein